MLSKKVLKDIQSLGLKKHRTATGHFIAEGPKLAAELLQLVPGHVQEVYATEGWADAHSALLNGLPFELVSPTELERMSQLQTPNAVLLVLRQWTAALPKDVSGLVLYLDTIRDPGNFGTIIRTADWFGVQSVVCSEGCAELFNPKVVQATMGSIARVPVAYDVADEWIRSQRVPLLAAALDGKSIHSINKEKPAILLIGNEGNGLRPELMALATERITIPRIGNAESLNAAVATGILLSHLT